MMSNSSFESPEPYLFTHLNIQYWSTFKVCNMASNDATVIAGAAQVSEMWGCTTVSRSYHEKFERICFMSFPKIWGCMRTCNVTYRYNQSFTSKFYCCFNIKFYVFLTYSFISIWHLPYLPRRVSRLRFLSQRGNGRGVVMEDSSNLAHWSEIHNIEVLRFFYEIEINLNSKRIIRNVLKGFSTINGQLF